MRHCSLFCAGPWPFLILPLALLLPVLYFSWHSIEEQVARNVQQSTEVDHSWAVVETFNRGREVLLTGEAPSETSVAMVLENAKLAEGVNTVAFVGDIAPEKPPKPVFKIARQNGKLIISGKVSNRETIDSLTAATQKLVSSDDVRNDLKIDAEVSDLQPMNDILLAFSKIDESGAIQLENGDLTLSGQVSSPDEKALIGRLAARGFLGNVLNDLNVVAPPCQDTIRGLLDGSRINFEIGESTINADSDGLLSKIAAAATECVASQFEVVGHTDDTGNERFNQNLSQERADAVVAKLEALGLDKNRFSTRGAGTTEPTGDNSTSAGRASNRRIEFRVTN